MNKVVCNICGTTYPENATQCPICGFAHSADTAGAGSEGTETTYTHVRGGRFSKANVRKRNNQAQQMSGTTTTSAATDNSKKPNNKRLVIVMIILLLAIVSVVAYIALRFFIPNTFMYEGLNSFTTATIPTEEAPVTELDTTLPVTETSPDSEPTAPEFVACVGIALSQDNILLNAIGDTYTLLVTLDPVDAMDTVSFLSSDESVAVIDENGVITAIGEGNAVITVFCGEVSAECTVNCVVETEPVTTEANPTLLLNRKEITFDAEGQSWVLYNGEIDMAQIIWSSDDNSVATIQNGKVVAVGNGDTIVYAVYGEQTASCIIHCSFTDDPGSGGGVSEAGSDSQLTYMLYNPYGNAEDVTLRVNEQFTLKLVDENKNEITDAVWTVKDTNCCSYENSIVTALAVGTTEITATYGGSTYTCIVRII